ncbi:PREDICTED: WD repeat-containing protein 46 [Thamnophis sirtalis]|uniref:WD repeat-containing protein 46 n=1 Tax=Thamnophis sirtalis TaxID=35019 RepID=A0A6I9YM32_9SAUR|nr:PREDICTED: WD repeat-containing protein 46 [Thamnophis sirtalis]
MPSDLSQRRALLVLPPPGQRLSEAALEPELPAEVEPGLAFQLLDPAGTLWSGKEAGAHPRWAASALPGPGEPEVACEINPYHPREAHVPWAVGLVGQKGCPRSLEGRWVIATVQNPQVDFGVSSILHQEGPLPGKPEASRVTMATGMPQMGAEIAAAVDLAASAKHFELLLDRFGPYRLSYTRNGRHLLLGGRRGHVAALDWQTKSLMCEINVMETITDLTWLHTETLFAVAQRKWLYVYDQQGVELNCLKRFNGVQRMEFLPYHFLLATASESGFLQYLDISVGKEVATICTKAGRLAVMAQNPSNAIVHLGHSNGTVTLWSPSAKAPLARMLCHQGAVRAVAIDPSGSYMATSGLDHKLHIYDLRAYRRLHSLLLPCGAGLLDFSQRGLLGAACQEVVQVYKDVSVGPPQKPYLCHRLPGPSHGLRFCPFEDVLGVGHQQGLASLLVPGAGEPNFDALENNPFRSRRQRQEWEVKAFLEKIPSELISLDPTELGRVDPISSEQQRKERAERLGYDPEAKEPFSPRRKLKGRDSAGSRLKRRKKVAAEEQRALVRKSLAAKAEGQPAAPKTKLPAAHSSALDRFRK